MGGEFGRHFRARVGAETVRRVNRLLDDYNAPRYPDWESPSEEDMREDLDFVAKLIDAEIPSLIKEARP